MIQWNLQCQLLWETKLHCCCNSQQLPLAVLYNAINCGKLYFTAAATQLSAILYTTLIARSQILNICGIYHLSLQNIDRGIYSEAECCRDVPTMNGN